MAGSLVEGRVPKPLYTAQAIAELGPRVTLLDCHPMHDLTRLRRAAPDVPFAIEPVGLDASGLVDRVHEDTDVVLIDAPAMGGTHSEISNRCIGFADEVVIPVPIHAYECRATLAAGVIRELHPDNRICALLWGGRTNSRATPAARTIWEAEGFDVLDPAVCEWTAYSSLTALLAHPAGDPFPVVAKALLARHNDASGDRLGQSIREQDVGHRRSLRRKSAALTNREREALRERLWVPADAHCVH